MAGWIAVKATLFSPGHMIARVAGVGQETAGDDGVGLVVARVLRSAVARAGLATGPDVGVADAMRAGDRTCDLGLAVEVHEITEPSRLIGLLETPGPFVIVDAVVGHTPGMVLVLEPEAFAGSGATLLTTHGIGVAQAVELARTLHGAAVSPRIRVVGVAIALPERFGHELSAPVAAAVPRAVRAILEVLRGR